MIQCFLLEPTDRASLTLRRMTFGEGGRCPLGPRAQHWAIAYVGTAPVVLREDGLLAVLPAPPLDDPRWPAQCACGYEFQPSDWKAHEQRRIYRAPDGREYTTRQGDAPAGAMWHEPGHLPEYAGPDGLSLVVVLPDGVPWHIDGPSRSDGRWSRTGTAPNITVTPSIASPGYHGFLRDGVLTTDLEGRTYPPREVSP